MKIEELRKLKEKSLIRNDVLSENELEFFEALETQGLNSSSKSYLKDVYLTKISMVEERLV